MSQEAFSATLCHPLARRTSSLEWLALWSAAPSARPWTRKTSLQTCSEKVTHIRAWEAALGPPEGLGERQGQVRALMTAGQGASASRPGILSPAGHLGLQVPLSVHLPMTKSSRGPLGVVVCGSPLSSSLSVLYVVYEALRNKKQTRVVFGSLPTCCLNSKKL